MQTKREALAEVGLAIAGARGKFSTKANEWLDAQRAAGVKFSDDNGPVKPAKPTEKPTGGSTEKPATGLSDYLFPSDFCWPESEYRAVQKATVETKGKKVYHGMREVCNNCRVSLVMCSCGSPTIYGNVAIEFERR